MLRRGSLVVDICLGEREEGRDDGDRNAVRFLPRPEEGTPVLGRAKKRSRVVLGSA